MALASKKMYWWVRDSMKWWSNYFENILGEVTAFPGRMVDMLLGLPRRPIYYPRLNNYYNFESPISSITRQVGRYIGSIIGGVIGLALSVATFWLAPFLQKTPAQKVAASLKELARPLTEEFKPVTEKLGLDKEEIAQVADELGESLAEVAEPVVKVLDTFLIPSTKLVAKQLAPFARQMASEIPDGMQQLVRTELHKVARNPMGAAMMAQAEIGSAISGLQPNEPAARALRQIGVFGAPHMLRMGMGNLNLRGGARLPGSPMVEGPVAVPYRAQNSAALPTDPFATLLQDPQFQAIMNTNGFNVRGMGRS